MNWIELKSALEHVSGLSKDTLHVYLAVMLQLGMAALTRRSLASALPWFGVLAAALANEWADLSFSTWPDRGWQYGESLKDVVNTLMLPSGLLLLARFAPGLMTRQGPAQADVPPAPPAMPET